MTKQFHGTRLVDGDMPRGGSYDGSVMWQHGVDDRGIGLRSAYEQHDIGRRTSRGLTDLLDGRESELVVAITWFLDEGDADVTDGHRAAPGDTAAVGDEVGHLANRLLGGGTIVGGDVTALQVTDERGGKPFVAEFFRSLGGLSSR